MDASLYPLVASKMLRHCEIFLATMQAMKSEEIVELAFNEFITSADRTIQYLHKEVIKIGGDAPAWFKNIRDNLLYNNIFYQLRNIIAHHYFIPLTPIIYIDETVPDKDIQVTEYRLDLEMLSRENDFSNKMSIYIKELGPSVNAISLCSDYYNGLSGFIREAEQKYGNRLYFVKHKHKSAFRVNDDLSLSLHEKQF
jgi:hypothetical protein